MAKKKESSLRKLSTKLNPYSTVMGDESSVNRIRGFLSTKYYALNAIISGDVYKGIPYGRVTTLFGASQSGKSLISALLQKSAQENGMEVIMFDTEYDKDGRMESNFNVRLEDVITMPIDTIEELIIQFTKSLESVIENEEFAQYLFVIDSLGFLSSEKELKDAIDKNKVAMDMGLKAKMLKTFFRNIRGKLAKSHCPLLMINHETADPSQQYESIFKSQGGGNAIEFISTVMVNVSYKKEKMDKTNPLDIESVMTKANTSGQSIRLFTHKNRLVMPHKQADCYLNFVTGPDRYSGLKDLLDKCDDVYLKDVKGNIGKGLTWYIKNGDEETKLGKYKDWSHDKKIWETHLLPKINEFINEDFQFKTHDMETTSWDDCEPEISEPLDELLEENEENE